MKTIISVLFVIIWIMGMFVAESYYPCGSFFMCTIGIFVLFLLNLFYDSIEEHDVYPLLMIFFMTSCFVMPIINLCFGGLRIINEEDSSIRLVSSFIPRTLATGVRVDTLTAFPRCYEKSENGGIVVYTQDLYMLKDKDSMAILFDKYKIILEGKNIEFIDREYGHGLIRLISYTKDGISYIIDSYGRDIKDRDYHVRMIEPTPDPGYVPNY